MNNKDHLKQQSDQLEGQITEMQTFIDSLRLGFRWQNLPLGSQDNDPDMSKDKIAWAFINREQK